MTPSSGDLRREILRSMIPVRVFEDQLTRMVREEHPPPGIQVEEAVAFAEESPDPPPEGILEHVWNSEAGAWPCGSSSEDRR